MQHLNDRLINELLAFAAAHGLAGADVDRRVIEAVITGNIHLERSRGELKGFCGWWDCEAQMIEQLIADVTAAPIIGGPHRHCTIAVAPGLPLRKLLKDIGIASWKRNKNNKYVEVTL